MKMHVKMLLSYFLLFSLLLSPLFVSCQKENEERDTTVYETVLVSQHISRVTFEFGSIDDLETFIHTRSVDPEDYPDTPKEVIQSVAPYGDALTLTVYDVEKEAFVGNIETNLIDDYGYLSAYDLFEVDPVDFESTYASFRPFVNSYTYVAYDFFFDQVIIGVGSIIYKEQTTLVDFLKTYVHKTINNSAIYGTDAYPQNGLVVRGTGANQIVYLFEEGLVRKAYAEVDGHLVSVRYRGQSSNLNEEDLDRFLADEKYAPFAPLFSEDDAVFEAAMESLTGGPAAED